MPHVRRSVAYLRPSLSNVRIQTEARSPVGRRAASGQIVPSPPAARNAALPLAVLACTRTVLPCAPQSHRAAHLQLVQSSLPNHSDSHKGSAQLPAAVDCRSHRRLDYLETRSPIGIVNHSALPPRGSMAWWHCADRLPRIRPRKRRNRPLPPPHPSPLTTLIQSQPLPTEIAAVTPPTLTRAPKNPYNTLATLTHSGQKPQWRNAPRASSSCLSTSGVVQRAEPDCGEKSGRTPSGVRPDCAISSLCPECCSSSCPGLHSGYSPLRRSQSHRAAHLPLVQSSLPNHSHSHKGSAQLPAALDCRNQRRLAYLETRSPIGIVNYSALPPRGSMDRRHRPDRLLRGTVDLWLLGKRRVNDG